MRLITYTVHLLDPERTMVASIGIGEEMPAAMRIRQVLDLIPHIRFHGCVDPVDGRHVVPAAFEIQEDGRVIAIK